MADNQVSSVNADGMSVEDKKKASIPDWDHGRLWCSRWRVCGNPICTQHDAE